MDKSNEKYMAYYLRELYCNLIDFINVLLRRDRLRVDVETNRFYLLNCRLIHELLPHAGLVSIKDNAWRPFDNLLDSSNRLALQWEHVLRLDCHRFLTMLEENVMDLDADDIRLSGDEKFTIESFSRIIEEYSKNQKDAAIHRLVDTICQRIEFQTEEASNGELSDSEPTVSISLPNKYSFKDVELCYVDDHTILVKHPELRKAKRCSFNDFGMVDRRSAKPNRVWKALIYCIEQIPPVLKPSSASKGIKFEIKRKFCSVFNTNEDPFHKYQRGVGWRIKCKVLQPSSELL